MNFIHLCRSLYGRFLIKKKCILAKQYTCILNTQSVPKRKAMKRVDHDINHIVVYKKSRQKKQCPQLSPNFQALIANKFWNYGWLLVMVNLNTCLSWLDLSPTRKVTTLNSCQFLTQSCCSVIKIRPPPSHCGDIQCCWTTLYVLGLMETRQNGRKEVLF